MATVHQFKEYIKQRAESEEVSCLLWNYFQCFHPLSGQDFKSSMIEGFYFRLLHNLHYRPVFTPVGHILLDEIQPFFRKHFMLSDFSELKSLIPAQMVPIESDQNVLSCIELFHKKTASPAERVQVLRGQDNLFLALKLKLDGALNVLTHSSIFYLRRGELTPLPPLSSLHYTPDFELEKLKTHTIFFPRTEFCCFQITPFGIERETFSTKDFSLKEQTISPKIKNYEKLFFNLKKIENYYIKPKSDPFYKELIQSLQSAYQLLLSNHPSAVSQAKQAMDQGRGALKDFYSNDRLLFLLMSNIEFRLKAKSELSSAILTGKVSHDPFIESIAAVSARDP